MEKEGVIVICLILAVILVIGVMIGCLIYFPPTLELKDDLSALVVGKQAQITLYSFGVAQPHDAFYYASDDPDIISVDQNGVITASKEGRTVIYVQSRANNRQKIIIDVEAKYKTTDACEVSVNSLELVVNNETDHAFWNRNSFAERIQDNDILELGKMVLSKGKDEYIFTDLYKSFEVKNENVLILSDWTNDDVKIYTRDISSFNLKDVVINRTQIDPLLLGEREIWLVEKEILLQTENAIKDYQSNIDFSDFDTSYEYRICIKINYSVYKTVNYYSKGLLNGAGSLVGELVNQEISSFLESYAYNETRFELELDGCELVIERRIKEK